MPYTPTNNPYAVGDPYMYDLKWIVAEIKKAIALYTPLSNDFAELKAYVENYFNNLDVSEEIKTVLEEMYADGRLEAIIYDVFNTYNYQRLANISRIGRFIDRFGDNNTPQVLFGQSCCVANGLYYVCGSNSDNSAQTITVWNGSGIMVNSATYTTLSHANDICYCGGYLYVATGSECVVIDPLTLAVVNTIARGDNISSLRAICANDENVYFIGEISGYLFGINKYTPADGTNAPLFDNLSYIAGTPQGAEYYDGAIYILYNEPNSVVKFDIESGEKDYIYNLPDDDGYYYTGEQESIFNYNGVMYLFTRVTYPESNYNTSEIAQIFGSDIIGKYESIDRNSAFINVSPQSVTIDSTATHEFNPRLNFEAIEEATIIKPNVEIRVNNTIQRGYFAAPRKNNISLVCTSGTAKISRIRSWGGNITMASVNADSIYFEGVRGYIFNSTIGAATVRFSELKTNGSTITYNNIQSSRISIFDNGSLKSDGSSISASNSFTDVEVLNPNIAGAESTYTKLQTLLAGKGTSYAVVNAWVLSAGVGYNLNGSILVNSLIGGTNIVLKDINNNTLTWNGSTFKLVDANNVNKTINQISRLTIVD